MSILKIKDANNNFVDVPSIKGRGISSIQKTSTSGLVDTYTITYSDGTTSTFNVTNGAGANADLENLKYYEYSAFSGLKLMYLYSGDYDYNTLVNGYSFGARLSELIYGLSTIKSQAGINESINDDNDSLSVNLKGIFSTLLNALTEDSYCMCNYYSTSVCLSPTSNQAIVMFGDGTAIQYEVSNNVETITYLKSDVYRAGTNISIANDGTINNTYTLPSDVVQDGNYVHTDNNYTTEEKTKLASLENYNDTQITELIENLEEENETLYNDHPDITETGTNIILNGTGDFKMKVDVSGNSTQIQYEGYNKLEGDTSYINTDIDSKTKLSLELWLSNSTVGSQDQKVLNGTTISSVGRYYYIFTPNSNTVGIVIKHNGSRMDLRKNFSIELQSGITYTISLDITGVKSSVKGGFSFDDVMIYEGTTEKPYEPYVGGTASPNPNYKQDINNVEGNVEVKGSSKNWFDRTEMPNAENWASYAGGKILRYKLKPNTQYTLSSNVPQSTENFLYFNGTSAATNGVYNGKAITQTSDNEGNLYVGFFTNRSYYNEVLNGIYYVQLEEGPTATSYALYKSQTFIFPLSQGQKLMLGDTLEDDGIHHKRGQITFTGTTATLSDAKTNGAYLCDQKTSGNLSGQTLTFDSAVTNATIEYELATETIEIYTEAQQIAYNKLKEMHSYYDLTYVIGTSDNAQPIITAHAKKSLKVMQDEIDNIESRLSVLE